MRRVLEKLSHALEILLFPGGWRAKLKTPAFNRDAWHMCITLARMGVKPATVLDVGANVGQFALAAGHILQPRKLFSFEPIPDVFGQLQKLPLGNGIDFEPVCMALSDVVGQADFRITSQSASSSLLPLGKVHQELYPEITEDRVISVRLETLDTFLKTQDCPEPRLLKLDVQGSELDVLKGCQRLAETFSWILLETSTIPFYRNGSTFSEIEAYLTANGFRWLGPVAIHEPCADRVAPTMQFDALYGRDD